MNEFRQNSCKYNVLIFFWWDAYHWVNFQCREVKIKYVILALRLIRDLNAFATAVKFEMLVVFLC